MQTVQIKMFTDTDEYGFSTYAVRVFINNKPINYKRDWTDITKALENVGFLELVYKSFNDDGRYTLLDSVI